MSEVAGFTIIRSKRKSLELSLKADGALQIRAPLHLAKRDVLAFLKEKASWVAKQRERLAQKTPPLSFEEGENLFFLGKAYPLKLRRSSSARLIFNEDSFLVALPDPRDKLVIRALFAQFLLLEAKRYLFF